MPRYIYNSVLTDEEFIIYHNMSDPPLTHHPETGEEITRAITAPAIKYKGLRSHVSVNYKSPAATACGCASNVALAKQVYANSKQTPKFGSPESKTLITGGLAGTSNHSKGHSHGHSHGQAHSHKHHGKCNHSH